MTELCDRFERGDRWTSCPIPAGTSPAAELSVAQRRLWFARQLHRAGHESTAESVVRVRK